MTRSPSTLTLSCATLHTYARESSAASALNAQAAARSSVLWSSIRGSKAFRSAARCAARGWPVAFNWRRDVDVTATVNGSKGGGCCAVCGSYAAVRFTNCKAVSVFVSATARQAAESSPGFAAGLTAALHASSMSNGLDPLGVWYRRSATDGRAEAPLLSPPLMLHSRLTRPSSSPTSAFLSSGNVECMVAERASGKSGKNPPPP